MQKLKFANILVIAGLAMGLVGCGDKNDYSGSYQNKKGDTTTTLVFKKKDALDKYKGAGVKGDEYDVEEIKKNNTTGETQKENKGPVLVVDKDELDRKGNGEKEAKKDKNNVKVVIIAIFPAGEFIDHDTFVTKTFGGDQIIYKRI